jgi:hypothetical protein
MLYLRGLQTEVAKFAANQDLDTASSEEILER